jgi:hypothetical protein
VCVCVCVCVSLREQGGTIVDAASTAVQRLQES